MKTLAELTNKESRLSYQLGSPKPGIDLGLMPLLVSIEQTIIILLPASADPVLVR